MEQISLFQILIRLLREATRAAAVMRYALALVGFISLIAITYLIISDARIAVIGTFLIVLIMAILVILSNRASRAHRELHLPGQVLIWFTVIFFMAVLIALFACIFFRQPLDLSCWITSDCSAPAPTTTVLPVYKFMDLGENDAFSSTYLTR